mgnify:CR=1 FL=1|jgi:hypothetical protein
MLRTLLLQHRVPLLWRCDNAAVDGDISRRVACLGIGRIVVDVARRDGLVFVDLPIVPLDERLCCYRVMKTKMSFCFLLLLENGEVIRGSHD